MSYTDCIARISQLEALVNGSQNWASTWGSLAGLSNNSTTSSATSTQAIDGNSPFAGVLEGLTGGVYVTSAGIAANAAALGASATSGTTSSTVFDSPLPSGRLTQDFGPTSETLEPSATVNGVTADLAPGTTVAGVRFGPPLAASSP